MTGVIRAGQPLAGRRVLLGVTGGIAAYKAIGIARELSLAGAAVDVVLTAGAREFVTPVSFQALTGRDVHTDMFGPGESVLHVRLAREADLVLVVPATANFLARAAVGMADDLLSTILLATRAPVLLCPAMNDLMYTHPQTRANLERLELIGYTLVGPADGPLAWGEGSGLGRLEEPFVILAHAARALAGDSSLGGKKVVVTAGPTWEPIDPVRFIGNRSSGRMGFALAATAWQLGAEVTLITGPTSLEPPAGVHLVRVETAAEMLEAVRHELPAADALVMAAAVADFRPVRMAEEKIGKRQAGTSPSVELAHTEDILRSTLPDRKPGAVVVGFAL
ncbi:MAG: bifunctional phosphopantothenoylcysteine decarboxylase/phosphopantothenate--cysteine ligase CoaBC, partial [Gemmatimonadota bacterium]|nr:bifunctional phosphopantothenoylcysteine decarboxylase/phosphopantothenate--cysteine ligase CoaBC [Gemmatimonadota bacterium]